MADDDSALWIEGQAYTTDDLTFREQRQLRDFIRELAPDGDPDEASEADIIPAFICVVKRRETPEFTLDQAQDFKPGDVERPPTRARAKAK